MYIDFNEARHHLRIYSLVYIIHVNVDFNVSRYPFFIYSLVFAVNVLTFNKTSSDTYQIFEIGETSDEMVKHI